MNISVDFPSFRIETGETRRLGDFLRKKLHISPSHLRRCLAKEWITVNQRVRTHKSAILATGDVVTVNATAFQIAQLRFAEPLLRTLYDSRGDDENDARCHCMILHKPAGMPLDGQDSETVESALPALMQHENYEVVEAVGRITSGPVIVSLNSSSHAILEVPKKYTFQLVVHGAPPESLEMDGFVSLAILQTVTSTTGDLSLIQVILTHSGNGLRGCLKRIGCPILGTSFSTKSTMNGCFFACAKLELLWNASPPAATTVDLKVPEKFRLVLERERKFHDVKTQREAKEEEKQQQLRKDFVERMKGEISESLLSKQWSVSSFCGLSFYITDDVMSPKRSSEVLIQMAKKYLPDAETKMSILDLGTGSGCLLVSFLVGTSRSVEGIGVDISSDALNIAKINIQSHDLSDRATLYQGDFHDLSFPNKSQTFDILLCNPPYLTEGECNKDRILGPRVALVAENRGLACYEAIARQVGVLLKPNGLVVLEVGGKRKVDEIRSIFEDCDHVETGFDNQGKGRCLVLRKSKARTV